MSETPDPTPADPPVPDPVDPAFVDTSRRAAAVGTVFAATAVVASLVAPVFSLAGFDLWPVLMFTAAMVMAAVAGFQLWLWTRVVRDDPTVWRLQTVSWAGHLLSYLIAILGLVAALVSMSFDGPLSVAFWVQLLGGLTLLLAQSTAAVQYLRRYGAPGTIPAHLRRLVDATSRLGS